MFLIDDDQPEVRKARCRVQQAMRGDDNVDLALLQALEDRIALLARAKTRQAFDAHRPVGEAVTETLHVLLGQQRRGHQHSDLAA